MAGPTAAEVVERTIAIIPWVANERGGYATFDEIRERFGIETDAAYRCLELAGMVGVHPYDPLTMIEIHVDPDGVLVRLPEYFRQPLRPSPEQVFLLVCVARVLTQVEGSGSSALHRALNKVLAALGDPAAPVEVELDPTPDGIRETIRRAVDERLTVTIEYYSFGSDVMTVRRVDPWRVQQSAGHWYLHGWCHEKSDPRVFRIDRIASLEVGVDHFTAPDPLPEFTVFAVGDDADRVRLRLAPAARWVPNYYPCDSVSVDPDGSTEVVLAVGSTPWLERLLLRLGPDVEVLEAPDHLDGVAAHAARRVLERYRQ